MAGSGANLRFLLNETWQRKIHQLPLNSWMILPLKPDAGVFPCRVGFAEG
jgi:hypothetical protein